MRGGDGGEKRATSNRKIDLNGRIMDVRGEKGCFEWEITGVRGEEEKEKEGE